MGFRVINDALGQGTHQKCEIPRTNNPVRVCIVCLVESRVLADLIHDVGNNA